MKKECVKIENSLLDFVYGEIEDKDLRKEIKKHISSCPECRAKVERYREIEGAVKDMKVDFEDSVWELHRKQIRERVEKEREGVFARIFGHLNRTFKTAGVAVLVLFIAGAGTLYYQNVQEAKQQRAVIEKFDMFENLEIIERLDFYTEITEKGNLL